MASHKHMGQYITRVVQVERSDTDDGKQECLGRPVAVALETSVSEQVAMEDSVLGCLLPATQMVMHL